MDGGLKFAASAMVLLIASSLTAAAADLPYKAPVRSVPAYNWNGFYVGAHAGRASQDPTVTFTPNDINANNVTCRNFFGGTCAGPASFDIRGAFGGFQVGYNWQVGPKWLVGAEADYDWSGIKGDGSSDFKLGFSPSTIVVSQKVKSFGTLRARVGYLPIDTMLVYATGGLAFGRINQSLTLNSSVTGGTSTNGYAYDCLTGPDCFNGSSDRSA